MFKNYLKTAARQLWLHKGFSCINVLGLTVGMTACFLILLYVQFETSYDSFHSKADRIYRLVADIKTPSNVLHASTTSAPMGLTLRKDFPEVGSAVRLSYRSFLVRRGDAKFQEKNTIVADSTFFKIFDFPLIYGDRETALREPMSIVLSRTAARKYFGDTNPVGQSVLLTSDNINSVVTGVMEDIPGNSQIQGDMLVSMSSMNRLSSRWSDSVWTRFNLTTYLLLNPGVQPATVQSKLPAFIGRYTETALKNTQTTYALYLEPLKYVYLHSTRDGNTSGNINNVYVFSIVGLFILFIACINFINLTTARSAGRAKEVGVRKVSGAGRMQLSVQFIGESLVQSLVAFVLTAALIIALIPLFNQLAGNAVSQGLFANYKNILLLFFMSVSVGVLAGIYPALVLSAYKPVIVLKGRFVNGMKGVALRKGLVIVQFTISIVLIISTMIVYRQLEFMRSRDLGFNKEQLMIIDTNGDKRRRALKQSLVSIPGVLNSSFSTTVPGNDPRTASSQLENSLGQMQQVSLGVYFVDFDFTDLYKMEMAAGRSFSKAFATDTTHAMLINESAASMLGYKTPQEAVGKRFDQWGRQGRIIGVVKDFHYLGLQQEITPLSIGVEENDAILSLKLSTDHLSSTISDIRAGWNKIIPNRPFEYSFLDETFDRQYRGEERFGKLFFNFSMLSIFISCLGLFGLSFFSTMQRTKEIGIRKVLGANVSGIVSMLLKDFALLVLMASLLACPVGWWGMHAWLQSFAYRAGISWWVFIVAAMSAMAIAMTAIGFQTLKAAIANPVKSLRNE